MAFKPRAANHHRSTGRRSCCISRVAARQRKRQRGTGVLYQPLSHRLAEPRRQEGRLRLVCFFQVAKQFLYARKKGQGAEFAETRGTLAVAVFARGDDGHEGHASVTGGQRIVNVVAEVEGGRGVTLAKDFVQTFRMRLFFRVVHGDDDAEIFGGRPALESERKLLPGASREQIQLEAPCPFFNLPRRDHQFFVSNVSELTIATPIKPFE